MRKIRKPDPTKWQRGAFERSGIWDPKDRELYPQMGPCEREIGPTEGEVCAGLGWHRLDWIEKRRNRLVKHREYRITHLASGSEVLHRNTISAIKLAANLLLCFAERDGFSWADGAWGEKMPLGGPHHRAVAEAGGYR